MERISLKNFEHFSGNWKTFVEVFRTKNIAIVRDSDMVDVNSAHSVFGTINQKYPGADLHPMNVDRWDYVSTMLAMGGHEQDKNIAEAAWYDAAVLASSPRQLFSRPLIRMLNGHVGKENLYVLTAREPYLKDITQEWYSTEMPGLVIESNILIRSDDTEDSVAFKVKTISRLAKMYDWVLYFEDAGKYVEAVLSEPGLENCFVVQHPLGKTEPTKAHDRLAVIGRYPAGCQGMYPSWLYVSKAIEESQNSSVAQY
jgi:hypothetical protein